MAKKFGYVRVSTKEQSIDLQVDALKEAGCDKIFVDEGVSGCLKHRPQFDELLNIIGAGDTLVTWKLDRMGRSLRHLLEVHDDLKDKQAFFKSLTESIDTSTLLGELVFQILGAFAQFERGMIRERTVAGMEVAASDGKFPGRPRKLSNSQIFYAYEQVQNGRTNKEISIELNASEETIRRRISELPSHLINNYENKSIYNS